MKNIHILPTDKPSRLHEYDYLSPMGLSKEPLQWRLGRNIYITSDEKIKNEDWCITAKGNLLQMIEEDTVLGFALLGCEKIILTTDQDLIKDGIQAIDDEFLEWFVKNPSCEFVKIEVDLSKHNGEFQTKYGYKIIIPKEEPKQDKIMERFIANAKQETLEEVAANESEYLADWEDIDMYQKGFIEGAKWQQERSYSEEEVRKLLLNCPTNTEKETIEWFEQFKKK